jgi:hypothetical protein
VQLLAQDVGQRACERNAHASSSTASSPRNTRVRLGAWIGCGRQFTFVASESSPAASRPICIAFTYCSSRQPVEDQYLCEPPWEGHHREYTARELRWMLERIACEEVDVEFLDYNMLQFDEL